MLNLLCNLTWKGVLWLPNAIMFRPAYVYVKHSIAKGRMKRKTGRVRESLILKEQGTTTIINDNNSAHNGHSKWQRLFIANSIVINERTLFIVRNNHKQQRNKTRDETFVCLKYRIRVCSSIPHILQNDVITGTLFLLFCMHNQHLISNQPILFTLRILFTLFPFLSHQRDYCSLTTNCSFRVMFLHLHVL